MKVALVQFSNVGKKYYFSYDDETLKEGEYVVVETVKGLEMAIIYKFKDVLETQIVNELKPIIRKATPEDILIDKYNQDLETSVIEFTKESAKNNELEMKILKAEYTLDRKKLTIYFESENRVDFRNLVKDLSEQYHTRIELRQIGPRDAAKLVGGIGPCGLLLCCNTFIGDFDTVSIKMAKNQNISLNPQKISGICGKLLCCIKYEDDVYLELKETLPDLNEEVITNKGLACVIDVNILLQKVKVRYITEQEQMVEWLLLSEINRK